MSDTKLRELERRWKETGSVEDQAAYLLEMVRCGHVLPSDLERCWAFSEAVRLALRAPIEVHRAGKRRDRGRKTRRSKQTFVNPRTVPEFLGHVAQEDLARAAVAAAIASSAYDKATTRTLVEQLEGRDAQIAAVAPRYPVDPTPAELCLFRARCAVTRQRVGAGALPTDGNDSVWEDARDALRFGAQHCAEEPLTFLIRVSRTMASWILEGDPYGHTSGGGDFVTVPFLGSK